MTHSKVLYIVTYIYVYSRRVDTFNQGPTLNMSANLHYFKAAI